MANPETKLTLADVVLGSFAKYDAHSDYSEKDLLLKLVSVDSEESPVARKQLFSQVLSSAYTLAVGSVKDDLFSFLDLLLVRNSQYVLKYIEWLRKLAELNFKVHELELIKETGCPPTLHDGIVFHSATADTEDKIKDQFGGVSWKRIVNFPLLVNQAHRSEAGSRCGASFICLTKDNLPNHSHNMTKLDSSGKDVWKGTNAGPSRFTQGMKPGLTWGSKYVYPEISPLNWNNDFPTNTTAPTSGASRYVKPHFNVPPYKDVYIWQCTKAYPDEISGMPLPEVDEPLGAAVREEKPKLSRAVSYIELSQFSMMDEIRIQNLHQLMDYDDWFILLSDELAKEEEDRYESKDAPVPDMGEFTSWYVWCKMFHIERRYLFKDTFKYLLEDIQDRIYLLMQRIIDLGSDFDKVPERLYPGEYVFLYRYEGLQQTDEELLQNYKLPNGCSFQKMSSVFLRGTPMFTEETRGNYKKYCKQGVQIGSLTTSGGLANVNLYADNFPKHLHWSNLLEGIASANVSVPSVDATTGGEGTDMYMNDPRTGGLKYGTTMGTGPYTFKCEDTGATGAIMHNNIPNYITMSVYLVS